MATANIKTISKLNPLTSLVNDDLFWVSHKKSNIYASYNTALSSIVSFAENQISSNIKRTFGLAVGNTNINVSALNSSINTLSGGNFTFEGTKIFNKIPQLDSSNEDSLSDNSFVTKKHVNGLILSGGSFIGSDSSITANPENDTPNTNKDNKLLFWRLPVGGNDSANYPPNDNIVECQETGQLVVYGWLADDGNVLPPEAWVAIYGKIKNSGQDKWTILQLQPWHVSERSKIIQYVGFNIPVKKGLKLKIKTGFRVGSDATATNSGNSLVFDNVESNVFVGYIIKT